MGWDNRVMFDYEAEFAQTSSSLPARVFLSVGMLETDELRENGSGRMISNLRDLLDVLKNRDYDGLEWSEVFFEDENHQSVIPPTISRGLRYIYGK